MRLIIKSNTHAPSTEIIISQTRPPPPIPNFPASHPPIKPPITPTMMLPISPNPPPLNNWPASHPETAPIKRKITMFMFEVLMVKNKKQDFLY